MSLVYWIWLQQALGYGSKYSGEILNFFGNAENVFNANESSLKSLKIGSRKTIANLLDKSLIKANKILETCEQNNIEIIPFNSKVYPENLREIPTPPVLLYAKGDKNLLCDEVSLCIVGPRKVSVYGKKAAFSLAARLALCGFTVVSGGALGCDTAAHKGALAVDGKTICFLGSGHNANYLQENKPLRDEIENKGLLISEFAPEYPASKYTFPIRNRLLAAFTLGTVVIEAGVRSGSLITANAAAEFGKEVFVIPGNPNEENYKGSNALLRDGAKPLLELADVITEYLPVFPHKIKPEKAYSKKITMSEEKVKLQKIKITEKPKKTKKIIDETLSKNAKLVYNYLDKQIFYVDDLAELSLTSSEILASLTELEIFGYVKAQPGGKYTLVN